MARYMREICGYSSGVRYGSAIRWWWRNTMIIRDMRTVIRTVLSICSDINHHLIIIIIICSINILTIPSLSHCGRTDLYWCRRRHGYTIDRVGRDAGHAHTIRPTHWQRSESDLPSICAIWSSSPDHHRSRTIIWSIGHHLIIASSSHLIIICHHRRGGSAAITAGSPSSSRARDHRDHGARIARPARGGTSRRRRTDHAGPADRLPRHRRRIAGRATGSPTPITRTHRAIIGSRHTRIITW